MQRELNRRLEMSFFLDRDVLTLSRRLLGAHLHTCFNGLETVGRIVEVEAYRAPEDKASHAYGGRYTKRNKVMYQRGGHAYVYLIYGIHHLFNVVTGPEGTPHAILIRGLEPVANVEVMKERRNLENLTPRISAGPGVLSQAMGITTERTGTDMTAPDSPIWLTEGEKPVKDSDIACSPRIGVDYAGEWAEREWRFFILGNPWVSK